MSGEIAFADADRHHEDARGGNTFPQGTQGRILEVEGLDDRVEQPAFTQLRRVAQDWSCRGRILGGAVANQHQGCIGKLGAVHAQLNTPGRGGGQLMLGLDWAEGAFDVGRMAR